MEQTQTDDVVVVAWHSALQKAAVVASELCSDLLIEAVEHDTDFVVAHRIAAVAAAASLTCGDPEDFDWNWKN